jgi:uncharacterized protein (DUF2267 family)
MTVASVHSVERTVHKTNEWIHDVEHELAVDDPAYAWRGLHGYLQVLRDRLTPSEAAQLAAELPQLLRGVFYEGFDPDHVPERIRDRDTFLELLAERGHFEGPGEAAHVAAATTRVLRKRIAPGEIDDVLSQLPEGIRQVLQEG